MEDQDGSTKKAEHRALLTRARPWLAGDVPGWLARRGFGPRVKMRIASGLSSGKSGLRASGGSEGASQANSSSGPDNIVQLRSYRRSAAA